MDEQIQRNAYIEANSLHMFRYTSQRQLRIEEFATPFGEGLNPKNRWILLSAMMPWDDMAKIYSKRVSPDQGAPTIDPRIVIGSMIIKHKMGLDDRGTIEMIQENPYMQYFLGLSGFQQEQVFDPSLFVTLRKRIGFDEFDEMTDSLLKRMNQTETNQETKKPKGGSTDTPTNKQSEELKNSEENINKGILKVDATVCDQYIPYPTDLNIVSRSRSESERIFDLLWAAKPIGTKPRTYRKKARKQYLEMIKVKRPGRRRLRKAIGQQLRYLRRNLEYIDKWLPQVSGEWLKSRDIELLQTIRNVYDQQYQMWKQKVNRCEQRIVNIYQPHVRPIVRGKAGRRTEFGAKICSSIDEHGISRLECIGWEAYNESTELINQIVRYKETHGYYPEKVAVDQIYGTRENRNWCIERQIELQVKPLGRPKKGENNRPKNWEHRNDIEGKFGEAKNRYGLNKIRAKTKETSESWISAVFVVMNLMALMRKEQKLVIGILAIFLRVCGEYFKYAISCLEGIAQRVFTPYQGFARALFLDSMGHRGRYGTLTGS